MGPARAASQPRSPITHPWALGSYAGMAAMAGGISRDRKTAGHGDFANHRDRLTVPRLLYDHTGSKGHMW